MTSNNYTIKRIEVTPVFVPFTEQVKQAMAGGEGGLGMAIASEDPWDGVDAAICKIIDNEGNAGLGEVIAWLPETGVSVGQVIDSIQTYLGRYLIGENPFNIEGIQKRLDRNVSRHEVAKGLLDMALYDLAGHITGRPAFDFMGGCPVDAIPLCALIPLADKAMMLGFAQMFYKEGYRTFRIKLGKNIQNDVEIMKMMRKKLGDDVRLRVDYNQAYTAPQAIRAIKGIEQFGIDFAEQPVDKDKRLAMAYVQQHVNVPLMSHEGFFSLDDFVSMVELDAVRVIGINTERPGGITRALKAIDYATLRGLGTVLHSQPLGISTAAHIHMTVARYNDIEFATELFGQVMIEDDLIEPGLTYHDGKVDVPKGPGWGVTLDEKALKKYAVGPTVVIE